MKLFEGMEHVETVKIHHPCCTSVEPSECQESRKTLNNDIYKQSTAQKA